MSSDVSSDDVLDIRQVPRNIISFVSEVQHNTVDGGVLGQEAASEEGVKLLGHAAVPADLVVDVGPPAGSVLIEEEYDGHDVLGVEGFYRPLVLYPRTQFITLLF